jgi:hypothetical protein
LEIIEGLTAKTKFGVTLEQSKRTRWNGFESHHSNPATYELRNRSRTRLISDNTLSYNKIIDDKHEINVLAGVSVQQRKTEVSTMMVADFLMIFLKTYKAQRLSRNLGMVNSILKLERLVTSEGLLMLTQINIYLMLHLDEMEVQCLG